MLCEALEEGELAGSGLDRRLVSAVRHPLSPLRGWT